MRLLATLTISGLLFSVTLGQGDDSQGDEKELTPLEKREIKQIEAEQKLRGIIGSMGTNQHYKIPSSFKDFGRRFVLQYPYYEKDLPLNITDESSLDRVVKAPEEIVVAVAKQSAIFNAPTPHDDTIEKKILRTGDYWNDVFIEEVDPSNILRTKETPKVDSLNLEFLPGSNLYELVSELKKISPRLLYVINDDSE
ncbi:uncharacterized protein LOC123703793 isoform X2 [Colias croceus]|uniref:uncharacterized protein LOC123703793 isoform X2 n=1 Tax=Colias crocea TaxID=72248 RepID=UPI001E2800D6|nr:uncharacterized protein LOC123703793 isoform X2 [Colias croceus]